MISVKNLTKTFHSGDYSLTPVNNVSLEVEDGTFAAIVGKSGSGKSTLLGLLGALDKPTNGSIEVAGKDLTKMHDAALVEYRRKSIGYVFQSYNLIPNLTALENVMLPLEFNGENKKAREKRAAALLKQVGLDSDKQLRRPNRLSGGEQQRVAIARALANKPKLILADEPTGNLDEATGKIIFDLLHSLSRSQNTTIIVVTHDVTLAGKTDQTFKISDGKLRK